MPNHCDTDLIINGPAEIIKEVLAKHFNEDGELICDSVIPYPEQFKRLDEAAAKWEADEKANPSPDWRNRPKDGFNSGGYEWCVENWGTKWGTYDGQGVHITKRGFGVTFQSAWSPPEPVLNKLAEMYPALEIQMDSYECGAAYQVHNVWKNGELIETESSGYSGSRGG